MNGGYGGVQQSLVYGILFVVVGQIEDKVEVCVCVGWFGVGVNLCMSIVFLKQVGDVVICVFIDLFFCVNVECIGVVMCDFDVWVVFDEVLSGLWDWWFVVWG